MRTARLTPALALLLVFITTQGNAANTVSRQIEVDSTFQTLTLDISGTPDGYEARMKILSRGGRIEVCGVAKFDSARFRNSLFRILVNTKLTLNGKAILRDFNYFTTIKRADNFIGAMANCADTGVALPSGPRNFAIDWPNMSVSN